MTKKPSSIAGGNGTEIGGEYWPGFSDLMAGLILIFAFLTVFSQIRGALAANERRMMDDQVRSLREEAAALRLEKQSLLREVEKTELRRREAQALLKKAGIVHLEVQEELEQLRTWKQAILRLCTNARLAEVGVRVDCETGAIELPDKVFFEFNQQDLTEDGKARLRDAIPIILQELRKSPKLWERIDVIEVRGHADPVVRFGRAYETNLAKSQGRAYGVLEFLTSDGALAAEDRNWLKTRGVASGAANERPPLECPDRAREECHEGMRRVELLLGFADEDIRKRFNGLLTKVEEAFAELSE